MFFTMLPIILFSSVVIFFFAYRIYGAFLSNRCGVNDKMETPAVKKEDGVDYSPTRASVLFGHHFSSIAVAGPIVGPILAATYFGWGPTWAWILVGAIFINFVHGPEQQTKKNVFFLLRTLPMPCGSKHHGPLAAGPMVLPFLEHYKLSLVLATLLASTVTFYDRLPCLHF